MSPRHTLARTAVLVAFAAFVAACTTHDGDNDDEASDPSDATLESSLETPDDPNTLDAFEGRASWIDTYASYPSACVDRIDPIDGARAVFHGCYDWHSSVHAHWAVLRADREGSRSRPSRATHVHERLSEAEMAKVADDLRADPSFESPYGRAWLLRLVTEHVKWSGQRLGAPSARLRTLGDETARGLIETFTQRLPDPARADYRSDAWTVAQLFSHAHTAGDAALETRVRDLVARSFVAHPLEWDDTNDHDPASFFSAYWSQAYVIALTQTPARALAILRPELLSDAALTPLADPGVRSDVHHLGINWSRAWGIKALARHAVASLGASHPTSVRLSAAYHAHVRAGRERHLRYRGDYYAYDHWVPQFAIYAITD